MCTDTILTVIRWYQLIHKSDSIQQKKNKNQVHVVKCIKMNHHTFETSSFLLLLGRLENASL